MKIIGRLWKRQPIRLQSVLVCLLTVIIFWQLGPTARAESGLLRPFVLASIVYNANLADTVQQVADQLTAAKFTVVGRYQPYPEATILIVSHDALQKVAAASQFGGYGAVLRVAITQVGAEIQVSYSNPLYIAQVFQLRSTLSPVSEQLSASLGAIDSFGAKGLTEAQARHYHYMVGMEYFEDAVVLAEFTDYASALAAVESGLASGKTGASKVYRVDIKGKQETVFGVALRGEGEAQQFADDRYIMQQIDFKPLKASAHLPYEVLVSQQKVYALHPRFRIAINFPDLSMVGKNSFARMMPTPNAILTTLKHTVSNSQGYAVSRLSLEVFLNDVDIF